jgi:hypothetical protein
MSSFIRQCKALDAHKGFTPTAEALQAAESLELDETLGYFMVQADHARANEKFAARLNELLAERRAA